MPSSPSTAGASDFDFMIGDWQVHHRRLDSRLTGCTAWTEFSGTSSTRKILGGFGNVEDNVLRFPEGEVKAAAFRSFNETTQQWAIWWPDRRDSHTLDVPVVGSFVGTTGTFLAENIVNGKPVTVRFIWNANPGDHPIWEQAFSEDGGTTWEINWIMRFTRR